jgi:chromosome partitioning protein
VQKILIANPKGGCGKTTIATNIAGFLAGKRQRVVLQDLDPQGSATLWLERRPPLFPAILGVTGESGKKERQDFDPQWMVIDSPAALHGDDLRDAVRRADAMLVPVSPSAFDMAATRRFLDTVTQYKAIKQGNIEIALVANRVDARTHSAADLEEFLKGYEFPLIGHLRDTQVYVYCARDGLSVFDLPRSRGEQDWEQWRPLTRWVARHAAVRNA